jgi:hypothetical protein
MQNINMAEVFYGFDIFAIIYIRYLERKVRVHGTEQQAPDKRKCVNAISRTEATEATGRR